MVTHNTNYIRQNNCSWHIQPSTEHDLMSQPVVMTTQHNISHLHQNYVSFIQKVLGNQPPIELQDDEHLMMIPPSQW